MSVYLPDDLYQQARERGLPISTLAQDAIAAELRRCGIDQWIAGVRQRPARVHRSLDTAVLIGDVRDGFGA